MHQATVKMDCTGGRFFHFQQGSLYFPILVNHTTTNFVSVVKLETSNFKINEINNFFNDPIARLSNRIWMQEKGYG